MLSEQATNPITDQSMCHASLLVEPGAHGRRLDSKARAFQNKRVGAAELLNDSFDRIQSVFAQCEALKLAVGDNIAADLKRIEDSAPELRRYSVLQDPTAIEGRYDLLHGIAEGEGPSAA